MEHQEHISKDEVYLGKEFLQFSISDSVESLTNLLQTIKQYRDFSNPDDSTWFEYIREFFNTLGLNTQNIAPRLIGLHSFGAIRKNFALACLVGPKESFDEIAYGIDWKSYLYYASRFYKIDWVILTNGLKFVVLNFGNDSIAQEAFRCELDEIIKNNDTASFFTLYKLLSVISNQRIVVENEGTKHKQKGKRILSDRHYQRREFWTQLLANAQNAKTQFAKKKTPGVESYLNARSSQKGVFYSYIITENDARIQLYIDSGDKNLNKRAFDLLLKSKEAIENSFGHSLTWDRLEDNRASLIRYSIEGIGLRDKERWTELQEKMIETMIQFEKAFETLLMKIGI